MERKEAVRVMQVNLSERANEVGTLEELPAHIKAKFGFPPHERLAIVRDVASAVQELHTNGVAHQDIKPSNVVLFKGDRLKVTDLGSASCLHLEVAPHDSMSCIGEMSYAPYERLYDVDGTWYQKKMGCDLFLVGNFAFTLFVGIPLVPYVIAGLPEPLTPLKFGGPYRDVLPDIESCHNLIVREFLNVKAPEPIRQRLVGAVMQMCHPNPQQRGHPKSIFNTEGQYDLHRYISLFNHLSSECKRLGIE